MLKIQKTGTGEGEEISSSTMKKKEDVLNQARAVLRQSQQFRPAPVAEKKTNNNDLSNRLAFQQQTQEDLWSPGGVVVDTAYFHQQQRHPYEGGQRLNKLHKDDDSGLPFRDAMRNSPASNLIAVKLGGKHLHSQLSSSSTTISLNTSDLNASSDESDGASPTDSDSERRPASSKKKKHARKQVKISTDPKELPTVKLTPLTPAPPADSYESGTDGQSPRMGNAESSDGEHSIPVPSEKLAINSRATTTKAEGLVEEDELGFSRALIKKSENDPHWFEKALLVRGESISEAAYKAFKKAQTEQESGLQKMAKKKKPIFVNLTDPEYTADWISDIIGGDDKLSEVDDLDLAELPESEYVDVDDYAQPEEICYADDAVGADIIQEVDDIVDEDENTMSFIKTASELEGSVVLDEISKNLQSLLEISEKPASQGSYSADMTEEEKTFAKDYDEAVMEESEPLRSIFNDIFQNPAGGPAATTDSRIEEASIATTSKASSQSRSKRQDRPDSNTWIQYEGEEEYDNTFIEATTTSTRSNSKSASSKKSISFKMRIIEDKDDETEEGSRKESSSTISRSKPKTEASYHSQLKSSLSERSKSSKSKSAASVDVKPSRVKSKPSGSIAAQSSKRQLPTGEREPHPSSRYQKNIQAILEKEVYQKELKRRRSQKLREERTQERMKLAAKESLERNKKTTYKDPAYTEILLPELFKYKSVSGLQAAKAKRLTGINGAMDPMNYGAPYFSINGALASSDQIGAAGMLQAAQVDSLDIPDLVREVLASNERMYKMTIEAGKQMAKVYKNKVRIRK